MQQTRNAEARDRSPTPRTRCPVGFTREDTCTTLIWRGNATPAGPSPPTRFSASGAEKMVTGTPSTGTGAGEELCSIRTEENVLEVIWLCSVESFFVKIIIHKLFFRYLTIPTFLYIFLYLCEVKIVYNFFSKLIIELTTIQIIDTWTICFVFNLFQQTT